MLRYSIVNILKVDYMKHINVVKFKVKAEFIKDMLNLPKQPRKFKGMINEYYVQISSIDFIAIGVWESEDAMIKARPDMILFLDKIRPYLQSISPELGVTDPVSGKVVFEY